MSNLSILIVGFAIGMLFSCTADRTFEKPRPIVNEVGEALLFYWDFNDASSTDRLIRPTIAFADANLFYQGNSFDSQSDGSDFNLRESAEPGGCLRLRNPSEYLDLVVETIGYGAIKIQYAAMRTNSGAKKQQISYSSDGQNFLTTGLLESTLDIGLEWALYEINLSAIPAATNHPGFTIRLTFEEGNAGESGNQRIDNLSVEGKPLVF
jgi:hypothetical protein